MTWFGYLILGWSQFMVLPQMSQKNIFFKGDQKWHKNNHLASSDKVKCFNLNPSNTWYDYPKVCPIYVNNHKKASRLVFTSDSNRWEREFWDVFWSTWLSSPVWKAFFLIRRSMFFEHTFVYPLLPSSRSKTFKKNNNN